MKKEKIQLKPRCIVEDILQEDTSFVDGGITGTFKGEKSLEYLKAVYSKADALYEDTIVNAVGQKSFEDLKYYGLIESCGNIGGRRLYAI